MSVVIKATDSTNEASVTASNELKVAVTTFSGAVDTELPAAASLSDTAANPSAPAVAADTQVFNGATWERVRSATAAEATSGTGVPAAGVLGFDGADYHRIKTGPTGDVSVSITSPSAAAAGIYAGISGFGNLAVSIDPIPLFTDTFEGVTFDTVNRWNTYGSVAATQTVGNLNVNPATTASATVAISSQTLIPVNTPMELIGAVSFETGTLATGNHRFWGFGTAPANVGTAAAPLTDAMGFELDTSGVFRASAYAAGTRVATTVVPLAADGARHILFVAIRGDIAFFYKDDPNNAVATIFAGPASQQLPVRVHSLNSGTVTGTPVMAVAGLTVLDWARQATGISDGTYPWRKAAVTAGGALTTTPATTTSAALASVAASITTTTLLAANAARKMAVIWNESAATLYVALGAIATTTAYTWQVQPGGYLELPGTWVGAVAGIWSAATGNARTTDVS